MRHGKKIIFLLFILITLGVVIVFNFGLFGPHRILIKTAFTKLPDWQIADHGPALQAFQKSCNIILRQDPTKAFGNIAQNGRNAEWQRICQAALQIKQYDKKTVHDFFEKYFQPYSVANNLQKQGMFTGYYLPLIHASLQRDNQYTIPIYGVPRDLVQINLGEFAPDLTSKVIAAKLQNHVLIPYPDRRAINAGAIVNLAPVLAWANNAADVFFAQVQGSALFEAPDHQLFLLSYAGNNGRPYTSIGKILVAKKQLTKETVSMQSIRAWLDAHPDQAQEILNYDASYVFFNISPLNEPIGSEKIALTPERTLAVDTHYIPLGAPIWLNTQVPKKSTAYVQPFHQLMIAQDSGGAIRGVVRGDVFWGAGEDAEFTAGHMQSSGQYWILLPRRIK